MAHISNAQPATSESIARRRSANNRKMIETIASHVALVVLSLVFLVPFLWLVSTSLKPDTQILVFPPVWIPQPATI